MTENNFTHYGSSKAVLTFPIFFNELKEKHLQTNKTVDDLKLQLSLYQLKVKIKFTSVKAEQCAHMGCLSPAS